MNPKQILEQAKWVLLVDWPSPGVPRALLEAGLTVYGFSPHRYSEASLVTKSPADVDSRSVFPPGNAGESGYLVFRALATRPSQVDLVCSYRPAEELPGIVANHVVPLRAKALWIQPPPATCDLARRLASEHGLHCVEGYDIAEVARAVINST
jgi:hypothetical protein